MLWSWNQSNFGSGDRHLCDGDVFCVTTPENGNWSYILHAYYPIGMESQKFSFFDSPTYPGFYVVKNDFGKCLSVKGNTNKTGARIMADDCKPSEAGQNWKWLNQKSYQSTWKNKYIYIFNRVLNFKLSEFIRLARITRMFLYGCFWKLHEIYSYWQISTFNTVLFCLIKKNSLTKESKKAGHKLN